MQRWVYGGWSRGRRSAVVRRVTGCRWVQLSTGVCLRAGASVGKGVPVRVSRGWSCLSPSSSQLLPPSLKMAPAQSLRCFCSQRKARVVTGPPGVCQGTCVAGLSPLLLARPLLGFLSQQITDRVGDFLLQAGDSWGNSAAFLFREGAAAFKFFGSWGLIVMGIWGKAVACVYMFTRLQYLVYIEKNGLLAGS